MKHRSLHAGRLGSLVVTLLALGTVATALQWGWNTVAADLLAQPPMHFRHALALELTILSVAVAARLATWLVPVRRNTAERPRS